MSDASINNDKYEELISDLANIARNEERAEDAKAKYFIKVFEAAFDDVIDLTKHKHGKGIDDAQAFTELYQVSRDKNKKFNLKDSTLKVLASETRTMIKFAKWTNEDPCEPLSFLKQAQYEYLSSRAREGNKPHMIDNAFWLIKLARWHKKSSTLMPMELAKDLMFKAEPQELELIDVIIKIRDKLIKVDNDSYNVGCAVAYLNDEIDALSENIPTSEDHDNGLCDSDGETA